jgi:hypothetical protein
MAKKPQRDEALEALDFIINVLKEHEKDLDRLINALGKTTEKFGDTGAISTKIGSVEERLSSLQTEISNLIGYISSSSPRERPVLSQGTPLIIRCKQWEEFKVLAKDAETVSFLFKDAERNFQVDALKNGKVLTYNGELPQDARLLKIWLSKELGLNEEMIFEGALGIE